MKNFFKILFLLMLCFTLTACGNNEKDSEGNSIIKDLDSYMEDVIPSVMDTSFEVPEEIVLSGENNGKIATLEWISETENIVKVSKNKKIMYLKPVVDCTAKIKCNIYVDGSEMASKTYDIAYKGTMTTLEYVREFNKLYLPDSVYSDVTFPDTEDQIFFKSHRAIGTVTYKSLNEDLLSSDGKYKSMLQEDEVVTLTYKISINGLVIEGHKNITVEGRRDKEHVDNAALWLEDTWKGQNKIDKDLDLPTTDDIGKVSLIWESNNKNVVDDKGHFNSWNANSEVVFTVSIKMNDYSINKELRMNTLNDSDMLEYIIDRMHETDYYQSYFYTYIVSGGHQNTDFGMLNFYTLDLDESKLVISDNGSTYTYGKMQNNENVSESNFKLMMIPRNLTYKRPLYTKTSTNFVTVHDTGDYKFNAEQWAEEVTTSSREVSWHFTVDDKEIIQHLPLDEVAWHAGDGGHVFSLKDTGVKYTVKNPEITVDPNTGILYINGEKSNCRAPYDENYKPYTDITPAGLYTELGPNGNYYINNYYYNDTYKKISNGGGNYNSIGIESCVYNGVEYSKVQKRLANLVAHLLNIYDLNPTQVMQHRNFSGKYCPQSMIRATELGHKSQFTLTHFMEMIEIEYFIIKYLPSLKVTYISNNPDVLSDSGEILKYVAEDTRVSYTVSASFNGLTYEKTYSTVIHPNVY